MSEDQRRRTAARRERQLVQIAALAEAGKLDRARGLAREHAAEFPADGALLDGEKPTTEVDTFFSAELYVHHQHADRENPERGDPDADAHRSVP